ncbi:endonuclease MutS2 [Spirochaetia bacterium]|nr:endonuclease MutS2 [Spirochaetia bacterium]
MTEKTFRLLEFDAIKKRVAECALSAEAAKNILDDVPRTQAAETEELKSRVKEILRLMRESSNEKRETFPEIGFLFPKLETEGAVLDIDEVYALGVFINRSENLLRWLGDKSPGDKYSDAPDCSVAEKEIFKVLDRQGKLRDLPEFREIENRIRRLNRDLETIGSRYGADEEKRSMLQSSLPSQRDGRLVLAVKANYRGRIRGIVHEVSSTGQTVFVEPEESVEINNELLIERRRLDAEIQRVLRQLSGRLAEHREDMEALHQKIIFIEGIRARARYGFETVGCFAEGGTAEGGAPVQKIVLKKARHPLLGSTAVPLDIEMDAAIRTVIITGPNTGGKTVALKTLGLLAMMNQFGLPLPVDEGTALPVFDGVYADIGDEQSLSQSLSTFSAHMTNIAAIIGAATSRSLVLLDELGSGTDPEEGSAIAMAILDHLIEKSVRAVITTHQGILKNYGYTREGVENASMEFDRRTLSPTFRIIMGIPGESRALEIAARNGLAMELVQKARHYLADERSDVSALISGLKEKRRELDAAAMHSEAEEKRLREERRQADLKELRLRQKELTLKSGGVGSLKHLLEESRKTLENLVREVKEGELSREKTLKVKDFLNSLAESAAAEEADLEREEAALTAALKEDRQQQQMEQETHTLTLGPGQAVLAGDFKRRGTILRAGKNGAWVVEIGSLRMTMDEKELIPIKISEEEKKPLISQADLAGGPAAVFELNLLGQRESEALESLRRQLDAAILSGLHEFSVVHGKGDGILQKAVHEFLKVQPQVADYYFSRPELGGFGRTEVLLKS